MNDYENKRYLKDKNNVSFLSVLYYLLIFALLIGVGYAIYTEKTKHNQLLFYSINGKLLFQTDMSDSLCYDINKIDSVTIVIKEIKCTYDK